MRVAFVNLRLSEMTGVTRAIGGQVQAARAAELPIDFWVVSASSAELPIGVRHAPANIPMFGGRAAPFLKARVLAGVRELDKYDVIFLRYPMAVDLDPLAFLRSTSAKVVTVHHTKEVEEALSAGRSAGALARAALEMVNGRRVLRRVDALVGVTDEIRDYELERSGSKPARTIANGIDVASIKRTGFMPFDGQVLHLLFIAGAHAPWHGTDRLLASLRRYRGPVQLVLHMVGESDQPAGTNTTEGALSIHHHGTLKGAELDAAFSRVTLAISSLAMFRNGLQQGCVLKTREYVARGLPFILGYDDVDLPEGLEFCANVANREAPFEVEPLIDLATRVSASHDVPMRMRSFAEQHLDWKVKMRAFHDFAQQLV